MLTESQLRFFGWIPATYRLEKYCNGVPWTQDGETYLCDDCDVDYFPDFNPALAIVKLAEMGLKVEICYRVPDWQVYVSPDEESNSPPWWDYNLMAESIFGLTDALEEIVGLVCERMSN